jgi:hypothetical protein
MTTKKPPKTIVPPPPETVSVKFGPLVSHQSDGSASVLPVCSTCGWPVAPGATCTVDGTLAK